MAITAVAAIAGASGVAGGFVAAQTLAMIAVGATAIGAVTKSKTLMKIGGGLGLAGAAGMFMGLGAGASEAASIAAAENGIMDSTVGAGGASEAASIAAAENGILRSPAGAGDAAEAAANMAPAEPVARSMTAPGMVENVMQPGVAPQQGGSAQPVAASTPVEPIRSSTVTPQTQPTVNAQAIKPVEGVGAAPVKNAAMGGFEDPGSFLGKFGKLWNEQTPTGKLAIGQVASGLIGGIGQGALGYMGNKETRDWQQQQIDQRRRDRAFIPDLTPYSR
jgi:hypothetical protein